MYLVFAASKYYPAGGVDDLVATFQGVPPLKEAAIRIACQHYGVDGDKYVHVFDTKSWKVIWRNGQDCDEVPAGCPQPS